LRVGGFLHVRCIRPDLAWFVVAAIEHKRDATWRDIAGNFGDDPRDIELARLKLANALLSVACEESHDVEALKNGALQAMALGYRERARRAPSTAL
jgi:hypothetical protein